MRTIVVCLSLALIALSCAKKDQPPTEPKPPEGVIDGPKVVDLAPVSIVYLRWVGTYDSLGTKFGEMVGLAAKAGCTKGEVFGVYYNSPENTPPESLMSDVCVAVPDTTSVKGLQRGTIAGGKYFTMTVRGPYEKIGDFYPYAFEYIGRHGLAPSGPCVEFYPDVPAETPPESLRTEIRIPVGGVSR